jgi:hypothetical protein
MGGIAGRDFSTWINGQSDSPDRGNRRMGVNVSFILPGNETLQRGVAKRYPLQTAGARQAARAVLAYLPIRGESRRPLRAYAEMPTSEADRSERHQPSRRSAPWIQWREMMRNNFHKDLRRGYFSKQRPPLMRLETLQAMVLITGSCWRPRRL